MTGQAQILQEQEADSHAAQTMSLNERLRLAFPVGVPNVVAAAFWWLDHDLAPSVAAELSERAEAEADPTTVKQVKELMTRLSRLEAEHTQLRHDLDRPQLDADLTARELADKMALATASERLIRDCRAELDRLRAGIREQSEQTRNCMTLARLAEVIAGSRRMDDELAVQLGLKSASHFVQAYDLDWRWRRLAKEAEREETVKTARENAHARIEETGRSGAEEAMTVDEAVQVIYGERPLPPGIRAAAQGPNSLNSDQIYGEELSGLLQLRYNADDERTARAYDRLIDALQVARYGEPKDHRDWTVLAPLAFRDEPVNSLGWRDLLALICEVRELPSADCVAAFFIEYAEQEQAFNWLDAARKAIRNPATNSSPRTCEAVERLYETARVHAATDHKAVEFADTFSALASFSVGAREKEEVRERINALSPEELIELVYSGNPAPTEVRKALTEFVVAPHTFAQAKAFAVEALNAAQTMEQAVAAGRLLDLI